MWIRSALWIGKSEDPAFFEAEAQRFVGLMGQVPGIKDILVLWPRRYEEGAPDIACQFLVFFDSLEAIDTMLAMPERTELRKELAQAVATFKGSMTHIDFEIGA